MAKVFVCLTSGLLLWAPLILLPQPAHACGGRAPATLSALPAGGATDVSPMTSIVLITGSSSIPAATVEAGGQVLPSPTMEALGSGLLGDKGATFWRLRAPLAPSTSYLVRGLDNGTSRELTSFTTAASYDKAAGLAPMLQRLRLWRVRYPLEQVGAGGCVFSEYEGYIDLDYQDGSVPGTPSAEIVTVLSLQPKTGGARQTFVFAGRTHFDGAQIESPLGNGLIDLADGAFPSPAYALWKPSLEADREYCATLTLYGRNDQAMPTVISNSVCAPVTNMDARPGNVDAGVATPDATAEPRADAFVTDADIPFRPSDARSGMDASSRPPDASIAVSTDGPSRADTGTTTADTDAASARVDAGSAPVASPGSGCTCSTGRGQHPHPRSLAVLWLMFLVIRPAVRRMRARPSSFVGVAVALLSLVACSSSTLKKTADAAATPDLGMADLAIRDALADSPGAGSSLDTWPTGKDAPGFADLPAGKDAAQPQAEVPASKDTDTLQPDLPVRDLPEADGPLDGPPRDGAPRDGASDESADAWNCKAADVGPVPCNDNPNSEAVMGTCQADGTCVCNSYFVLNPSTGRCMYALPRDASVRSDTSAGAECTGDYSACGCGCCSGAPKDLGCYYPSLGETLAAITAQDQAVKNGLNCNTVGCAAGVRYVCCAEPAAESPSGATYTSEAYAGGLDHVTISKSGVDCATVSFARPMAGGNATLKISTPPSWGVTSAGFGACGDGGAAAQAKGAVGTFALRASGSQCVADLHASLFAFAADGTVESTRLDMEGIPVTGLPAGMCQ